MPKMGAASMAICDGKLLDKSNSRLVHVRSKCKASRWLQTTDLTSSRRKDFVKGKIVLLRRLLGLVSWHLQGYSPSQQVPCITGPAPSAYTKRSSEGPG